MNIKALTRKTLKQLGVVALCLKIVRKFGYLTKSTGYHASGIDLVYDVSQNTNIAQIQTVFDVGASNGGMTRFFLQCFPKSRVYAFEPFLPSYLDSQQRYRRSSRVRLFPLAFSNSPGELKMYLQSDSGYNSLNDVVNKPSDKTKGASQMVKVETLDHFCETNGITSIDLLKVDTEGLDIKVLQGAEGLLRNRRITYIFVEATFIKKNAQNTQFEDLVLYLEPFNFKLRAIYDQSTYGNKPYVTCVNALFYLQPD